MWAQGSDGTFVEPLSSGFALAYGSEQMVHQGLLPNFGNQALLSSETFIRALGGLDNLSPVRYPSEETLLGWSIETGVWMEATSVADLAGNTLATARLISVGTTPTTFTDWVGSTDLNDYYRLTLNQASVLNVTLSGLTADADLELLDGQGNWLDGSWNAGSANETLTRTLQAGTYYLRVYPYSGSTFYNLTVTANPLPADGAGNTLAAARPISVGPTPSTWTDWVGDADPNDYYRLTLNQASVLNVTLSGLTADADLELYDGQGGFLAGSWNSGTAPDRVVRTLAPGTYYLRVFPYAGSTSYNLTVTASPLPTDGAGNTFETARPITVGPTTTTLTDWVGDWDPLDYYRFTLSQRSFLHVRMDGLTADAELELFDSQGNFVRGSWNWGTDAEEILQPLEAGTYYLRVYPYSGSTHYTLRVTANPIDQGLADNTLETARPLTVGPTPVTVTDWVGETDRNDYYWFTLNQASRVTITLGGLSADADLELLRWPGVLLQGSWNAGSAPETITRTLEPGTYYLRVFPSAGSTAYTLTVVADALTPELADNTLATARPITVGPTPLTLTDAIGGGDTDDYFWCTVNQAVNFSVSLGNLTQNADVQLLDSSGRVIRSGTNPGTQAESFTQPLNPGT
ncbi:MAG: PPC domain-containing protein, partial [Gloeomargarita sp. SKYG98]|nr:PPC domain-containing protein [Gloeomargarita sp. SKYG98]